MNKKIYLSLMVFFVLILALTVGFKFGYENGLNTGKSFCKKKIEQGKFMRARNNHDFVYNTSKFFNESDV